MALAAAQTAAHAESWAWQLLAHTPFNTAPRTPLMLRGVCTSHARAVGRAALAMFKLTASVKYWFSVIGNWHTKYLSLNSARRSAQDADPAEDAAPRRDRRDPQRRGRTLISGRKGGQPNVISTVFWRKRL